MGCGDVGTATGKAIQVPMTQAALPAQAEVAGAAGGGHDGCGGGGKVGQSIGFDPATVQYASSGNPSAANLPTLLARRNAELAVGGSGQVPPPYAPQTPTLQQLQQLVARANPPLASPTAVGGEFGGGPAGKGGKVGGDFGPGQFPGQFPGQAPIQGGGDPLNDRPAPPSMRPNLTATQVREH